MYLVNRQERSTIQVFSCFGEKQISSCRLTFAVNVMLNLSFMSAFLFILTSLYARRVRCSFKVMACLKTSMRCKRKDLLNALVEFQGRLPNSIKSLRTYGLT